MPRNAQEYLNNLINKDKIYTLNLSNQELTGEMNLREFANLASIDASKNKFTNLNWLSTLPNKEKLKWLNLWGNEIINVDWGQLFTEFSNLKISLENNPLSGSNLTSLNNNHFSQFVKLMEEGKLRVNSWKGTLLLELAKYTEELKK